MFWKNCNHKTITYLICLLNLRKILFKKKKNRDENFESRFQIALFTQQLLSNLFIILGIISKVP